MVQWSALGRGVVKKTIRIIISILIKSNFSGYFRTDSFPVQAGDINSALKSYNEAAKMNPTGQNLQRLTYNIGMLSEQAGDYNTSLKLYSIVYCSRSKFKDSRYYLFSIDVN